MTRYIGVVPVAQAEETTKKLLATHPHAGDTLTVGLSATGKEPATHYWFSWDMEPAVAVKFMAQTKDVRKDAAPSVETATKEQFLASVATAVKDGKKPPDPPTELPVTLYDSGKWTPDDVLKLTGLQRLQNTDR